MESYCDDKKSTTVDNQISKIQIYYDYEIITIVKNFIPCFKFHFY